MLYWQLTELGVHCDVVAPTLVPVKAGDRLKTDRRDALKLARCYRAGDLTRVWVPDEAHEALRDLVRAREAAKKDPLRARYRLQKLLLAGAAAFGGYQGLYGADVAWVKTLRVEPMALAAALLDYVSEVDHARERIERLERAIASTRAAIVSGAAPSPRPATRTCAASSSRPHGPIGTAPRSAPSCGAAGQRKRGGQGDGLEGRAAAACSAPQEQKRQREAC